MDGEEGNQGLKSFLKTSAMKMKKQNKTKQNTHNTELKESFLTMEKDQVEREQKNHRKKLDN